MSAASPGLPDAIDTPGNGPLAPDAFTKDSGTPGPGASSDTAQTERTDTSEWERTDTYGSAVDAGPLPDLPDTAAPLPDPCLDRSAGASCDDGNPCTKNDACSTMGLCEGEPYSCSDGKGCTYDECDGLGGCSFPLKGDRCLIDGACYYDGDVPFDAPCLSCVPPVTQLEWTADDTLSCDDGNFCTEADFCFGGICVAGTLNDCDDNNWCTDDGCDTLGGCTHAFNTRQCSDGDECTLQDTCTNGVCVPGALIVLCDDQNPCTIDVCINGAGCVHQPQTFACDDGDVCTVGDTCMDGQCISGSEQNCSDNNPCTDDICHPEVGCKTVFNTAECNDGNACTEGDICAFGTCQTGPLITLCNDGNPCTMESCDISSGECVYAPDNSGVCTDGNPCTVGDFCEAGSCISGGGTVDCDDGNLCTDDLCGPNGTCIFNNNLLVCSDDDPCTKGDRCLDGVCTPGTTLLNCFDGNPCTDDACVPGSGCEHINNNLLCNDGNACTTGDQCQNGLCIPGNNLAACNDSNPCTNDACISNKGCVNVPNNAICSDGDPCTTSDQCFQGECVGDVSQCDDNNECTKEICIAGGGCAYVPINSFECKPQIVITYPPRGAMLLGPGDVVVTGTVSVGGAGLKDFFINDIEVPVHPISGAFSFVMQPQVGVNIIRAIANSNLGGEDTSIRSYAWSTAYQPVGQAVDDAIGIWLSQLVFDDNNTSDLDDIATVLSLILESLDIQSQIPNPLTKTSVFQCTFTVKAQPVLIGNPQVDIWTNNQVINLKITYPNLYIGLDVDASGFLCPGVSGDVTASALVFSGQMQVGQTPTGDLTLVLNQVDLAIQSLNIDINGILGFLFNWIINFVEGPIANQIEDQVSNQLNGIPEILAEALSALAVTETFEIPAFIGNGPPMEVTLDSTLSGADFDQFGGFFEMAAGLTAGAKGVPYETKGSLLRNSCATAEPDFFDYLMQSEIEVAFKDDAINQMLHAVWYAGALTFPLDASYLSDVDLSEYSVDLIDVQMNMLLPPIVSSCNYQDQLMVGFGDMEVIAALNLFGNPLVITAYASAEIAGELKLVDTPAGPEVAIGLDNLVTFDIEIDDVDAGFEGAQGAVEELIGQFLGPELFTGLGSELLGNLPIPSIPLDGFSGSIPSGTELTLELAALYRLGGRTVLAGFAK